MNPHQWKNVINQNRDGLEKILMAFFQQNETNCPFPHGTIRPNGLMYPSYPLDRRPSCKLHAFFVLYLIVILIRGQRPETCLLALNTDICSALLTYVVNLYPLVATFSVGPK